MGDLTVRSILLGVLLAIVIASPVDAHWPVAGRSRISYWHSGHHAVDISAACGTRILSIDGGRVIWSGWRNNGGGYQVWIQTPVTGKDIYVLYAHMRRVAVWRGQWVARQQLIGWVGNSGWSTGCHLHVEIWRGMFWQAGSWTINPWYSINHGYWFPYN